MAQRKASVKAVRWEQRTAERKVSVKENSSVDMRAMLTVETKAPSKVEWSVAMMAERMVEAKAVCWAEQSAEDWGGYWVVQ